MNRKVVTYGVKHSGDVPNVALVNTNSGDTVNLCATDRLLERLWVRIDRCHARAHLFPFGPVTAATATTVEHRVPAPDTLHDEVVLILVVCTTKVIHVAFSS